MVSVSRFQVSRLADEVRDPAYERLIRDGYRTAFILPFEARDGASPEVFVVSVKAPEVAGFRLLAGLLAASVAVQVAALFVLLLR